MAAPAHPYRRPLLALILLSPVIAEMLSGSSPPLEWLNPVAALLLIWLYGSGVLVMRETVFINIRLTPYRPSVWHLLGAAAAVAFLVWAAKKYAGLLWARLPSRKDPRSPRVYALAGFGFLMGSFFLYGGGPFFGVIPAITILEGAAVLVGVMLLVRRTSDAPARWARQRFAFVAGAMGFLIVLAAFLELAGWRGMGVVGAAFTFLLIRLYRRLSGAIEVGAIVPLTPPTL